jgi:RimJ/RimL family protein N-acetyltransferase
MGQRIEIRRAQPEDAAAMAAYTEALVDEKLDTILLETPYTAEEELRFLEDYEAMGGIFLLALDGRRVVGMCDMRRGTRTGNRHMGVLGLGVLAGYRGQGIGRRLMERLIAEARAIEGFCRIELGVTPWNAGAIALYESLGFQQEGVKRKGIALRGAPEDDLLMALVW